MDRLPLAKPTVDDDELAEIGKVLATRHLTQGRAVATFEEQVAAAVGVRHAVATSSATTALHLSLRILGIGPGDEVIVPAFTFPATANVVVQQGAVPVFADVDLATFSVTPATVGAVLSARTAAIMPVDPFGYPAPMADLVALAGAKGLRVVEDAACAIGATRDGVPAGSWPDLACFSFHPRKVITTGEGGMITTDDDDLATAAQLLRNHGGRRGASGMTYVADGYNYRLSDVHGALGIAQMAKLPQLLQRRRDLAEQLDKQLGEIPGVTLPLVEEGARPTYQSYVVLLDAAFDRDRVITLLAGHGIESTVGTYGLHLEPFFRDTYGTAPEDCPQATAAATRSLSLPIFPEMTGEDTSRVAAALDDALRRLT